MREGEDWGDVISRLAFWYGLSYQDVAGMPMIAIRAYLEYLPRRLAEWRMMMAEATSLPYMREAQRREVVNGWRRQAGWPSAVARPATPEILRMLGIGFRRAR